MANRKRVKPKSDPSPLGFDVRTELDFCAGGRGGGGIRMTLCSVFSDQDEADLLETCK